MTGVNELFRLKGFENHSLVTPSTKQVETIFGELEYLEPQLKALGVSAVF
jgi:hypothetical protein